MEVISNCPVCNSTTHKTFLSCKDNTVSSESFSIVECGDCGFKFTSPRPLASDLGKYYKSENYISHSDNKKGLISKLYHWVRSYTLLKKLQLVFHYTGKKQGNILDYGAGTGAFLKVCSDNKWNAYGIEPDSDARKVLLERGSLQVQDSIKSFSDIHPEIKFDCITLWHVLEHIPDLKEFFSFIEKSLAHNGSLLIAVPNCNSYDAKHYKEYWAAYDLPRHLYHFTPATITKLLQGQGYKCVATLPMIFDSFYVSMLSEGYKNGKSNLLKAVWVGLKSNLKANKTGKEFSSQIYVFKKV